MTSSRRRLTLTERRAEWRRVGLGTYGTRGALMAVLAVLGAVGCAVTARWEAAAFLACIAVVLIVGLYLFVPPVMASSDD